MKGKAMGEGELMEGKIIKFPGSAEAHGSEEIGFEDTSEMIDETAALPGLRAERPFKAIRTRSHEGKAFILDGKEWPPGSMVVREGVAIIQTSTGSAYGLTGDYYVQTADGEIRVMRPELLEVVYDCDE
jgi:hypothetical protein